MKDRLKKLRKEIGLKQREIAERIGVSTGTVGQWESGVALPGDARIYKICKELNVREEWLREGKGEMFAPKEEPSEEEQREAQKQFIIDVFKRLTEEQQDIVLDTLRTLAAEYQKNGVVKTQTNNGTILGDMTQN